MTNNDNELNHLIWYFSLTMKEKDLLNTLPNNIKGGLDWMSLRGGNVAEVAAPMTTEDHAKAIMKEVAKRGRKKDAKAKAPKTIVKKEVEQAVKKGRGRPKKA